MSPDRFGRAYNQVAHWTPFTTNPGDKRLRKSEWSFVGRLLSIASPNQASGLLEQLHPWNRYTGSAADDNTQKKTLLANCIGLVAPAVASEAIEFIAEPNAVYRLLEKGRYDGYRYCLFNHASLLWSSDLSEQLIALIKKGSEDETIYRNCHDLLDILAPSGGVSSFCTAQDLAALATQDKFLSSLWQVIAEQSIQYRAQWNVIERRQGLIDRGVSSSLLPLTEELQARLDVGEQGHVASDS
jgi:hypothetical protein